MKKEVDFRFPFSFSFLFLIFNYYSCFSFSFLIFNYCFYFSFLIFILIFSFSLLTKHTMYDIIIISKDNTYLKERTMNMSTCNFKDNDDKIDLFVMSNLDLCKFYIGEEDEDGNEIEEYSDNDLDWAQICFDDEFKSELEEFADSLKWYRIKLESGYYDGVQLYIDTDWVQPNEWSDEDIEYEFDLVGGQKALLKLIDDERAMIEDFQEKVATEYGFRKLYHIGTFSNGEGVYRYA